MKRSVTWTKRKMMFYLILFIALCLFSLVSVHLAPHDAELVNLLACWQEHTVRSLPLF